MAKRIKKLKLPQTDSIEALAHFWDTHDLTEFEDELEEVVDPIFVRETALTIHLQPEEAKAVKKMVASHGLPEPDLTTQWAREKLQTV